MAAIERIHREMQIDEPWTLREERGFTWWGAWIRQRVWSGPATRSAGETLWHVRARTSAGTSGGRDVSSHAPFCAAGCAAGRCCAGSGAATGLAAGGPAFPRFSVSRLRRAPRCCSVCCPLPSPAFGLAVFEHSPVEGDLHGVVLSGTWAEPSLALPELSVGAVGVAERFFYVVLGALVAESGNALEPRAGDDGPGVGDVGVLELLGASGCPLK